MTIEYRGYARIPGPLGSPLGLLGGRIPGPLGFKSVPAPGAATKALKVLDMPDPAVDVIGLRARSVGLALAGKSLSMKDIAQGGLANCPIPAILAAMLNTTSGFKRVDSLIVEHPGVPVRTRFSKNLRAILSKRLDDDPSLYKMPEEEIASNGYFTVHLDGDYEVSDVFYAQYEDRDNGDLVYMRAPNKVIWPCVIEKAYAVKLGSYQRLNKEDITADIFWKVLVGKAADGFFTEKESDLSRIADVASKANRIPAIAGTYKDKGKMRNGLEDDHAYTILGFHRGKTLAESTVDLFNPWGFKPPPVAVGDFQTSFEAVYYGSP